MKLYGKVNALILILTMIIAVTYHGQTHVMIDRLFSSSYQTRREIPR